MRQPNNNNVYKIDNDTDTIVGSVATYNSDNNTFASPGSVVPSVGGFQLGKDGSPKSMRKSEIPPTLILDPPNELEMEVKRIKLRKQIRVLCVLVVATFIALVAVVALLLI